MRTINYLPFTLPACLLYVLLMVSSCKKFVDVDAPETNPSSINVYSNDAQAAGILTGIYGKISGNNQGFASGRTSITVYTGLAGDEFEAFTSSGVAFMQTYLNTPVMDPFQIWNDIYTQLYVCNAAIEGITVSAGMTEPIKKQLLGEAKFMRAFMHFYLVNLYGDVPLVTTTDYRINQSLPRTPTVAVYQQIMIDLTEAKELLSNDYKLPTGVVTTTERFRPNKAAATAMLARVHLYLSEWAKAEANATEIIGNTATFGLTPLLADIFSKAGKESIWQLAPTLQYYNTNDGNAFIRSVAPTGNEPVALQRAVLNAFATGDLRKTNWVDSITISAVKYLYPKKFKIKGGTAATTTITEYLTPLRVAEQFLIRAEARAKMGNLTGANSAQSDINAIRTRAGLGNTVAATEPDLLLAIEQERRIEFMTEWGHRWFDLKRTNRIDAVMTLYAPTKGITWSSGFKLFPLPRGEMQKNPNLQPQNPGYN
jgi:starch-binding outer membrane protein, SusD/RagB family